ncbi:MAG: hypothetical protein D6731_22975 [Planctomycetota bacterium]|nr:MAG: hypothetical protein D6731_22975 [Planctomycetota bacterium]
MSSLTLNERVVERAIAGLEERTSAEVVVAVANRSGDYRDAAWALACLTSLLYASVLILSPWFTVGEVPALCSIAMLGALAFFLPLRFPSLALALTSGETVRVAVDRAAKVAFVEEGVSATEGRTGLLIFVSCLERQARVLPDLGLQGHFPEAEFANLERSLSLALQRGEDLTSTLTAVLTTCGELLGTRTPRDPDDRNELEDSIRWRMW